MPHLRELLKTTNAHKGVSNIILGTPFWFSKEWSYTLNPLLKEVMKWNTMVFYQICHLSMKRIEYSLVGRDKRWLVAITTCQVLWGNDWDGSPALSLYQQNLRVVVCEVSTLNHLCHEWPELECLVCGLMVQNQVELAVVRGHEVEHYGFLSNPLPEHGA